MSPSSMHYRRYVTGLQDPISREGRGQTHRAVQCREAKRRCTVAPRHQRKYTRLWFALGWERYLLNQPRRHITAQPRTPPVPATNSVAPPLPLRLLRPVSSVQVPRREDGEIASIQTLYTHRRGGSPPLPLKTPTTSPSSPHRHLKTSTQPDNIKLNPPPAACLHGSRVSPYCVLPSPIHLRYTPPNLDITKQPARPERIRV